MYKSIFLRIYYEKNVLCFSSFGLVASDGGGGGGGGAKYSDSSGSAGDSAASSDGSPNCPLSCIAAVFAAAAVGGAAVDTAQFTCTDAETSARFLGLGLGYRSQAKEGGLVTCKSSSNTLYGRTVGRTVALNTRVTAEAPVGVLAALAGAIGYVLLKK